MAAGSVRIKLLLGQDVAARLAGRKSKQLDGTERTIQLDVRERRKIKRGQRSHDIGNREGTTGRESDRRPKQGGISLIIRRGGVDGKGMEGWCARAVACWS